MNLTRQNLSAFVGATYQTVFRVITQLTEDKIITSKGKNIRIENDTLLPSYLQPDV